MKIVDERIRRVLSAGGDGSDWSEDLRRLECGDTPLTRKMVGEVAIKAVQRLLVFLGYSTASSGAFLVDGDFGRGTNRGVAQFQFEYGLNSKLSLQHLCYPCSFQNARSRLTAIPDVKLDLPTLAKMAAVAVDARHSRMIPFGDFDEALFHLDSLEQRRALNCRQILEHYGAAVQQAAAKIKDEKDVVIQPPGYWRLLNRRLLG